MDKHGTVEHFQCFDVHVLHRTEALQETLVSYPWVSFEDEPQRQMSMKRLSRDEPRRRTMNLAKLPEMLQWTPLT
jgi:hypothetical protein